MNLTSGPVTQNPIDRIDSQNLVKRLLLFHRFVVVMFEVALFLLAGIGAFLLRYDLVIPYELDVELRVALLIWLSIKIPVFLALGLSRGWWRYVSSHDLVRIGLGNVIGSFVGMILIRLCFPLGFPRSVYLLDLILSFLLTAGVRVATRVIADISRRNENKNDGERVLIYGAGAAGVLLLREIQQSLTLPYYVVGFLDDNPQKAGLKIQGKRVFGGEGKLGNIVKRYGIHTVLMAIPSASGPQVSRILDRCMEAQVGYKTIPSLAEMIEGKGLTRQIRNVAVEDLLGRTAVNLDDKLVGERLRNQVVVVTGCGGSIGSELCRQIARFSPKAIVGYDNSEGSLFFIDKEMREVFPQVSFHAEIGSIRNSKRLLEVFERYSPSILYHAAAYKHVPLMERNVFEAVENNVFGTYDVARAATQYGIRDFVMISSDKAVRPTNVMGATKRLAELVIRSLSSKRTKFVSVRFGNVLGSSGSVIPIFKQQIAAGGPVTVTDPEMRRYFMTIPEAAQLVLQASAMSEGGEIFVLDMGQLIRIQDLARDLILLSGLRPNIDIKIEFTGARPGEKLYEELSAFEEGALPTFHHKIKVFAGNSMSQEAMNLTLANLRRICEERDLAALILTLKTIVPDYSPSSHVLQLVLSEDSKRVKAAAN